MMLNDRQPPSPLPSLATLSRRSRKARRRTATAAAPQSPFLQILSSCLKFTQNPKSTIQNFLTPHSPLLQSLRQPATSFPVSSLRFQLFLHPHPANPVLLSKIHPKSKIFLPPIPPVAVFATTLGSGFVEMILHPLLIQNLRRNPPSCKSCPPVKIHPKFTQNSNSFFLPISSFSPPAAIW